MRRVLLPLLLVLLSTKAQAAPKDVIAAVLGLRSEVPGDARTADTLGRERAGSGIVIDGGGLVLTIGYLILEASSVDLFDAAGKRIPAEVVGYDHETGLGLVRATVPLPGITPVPLGDSDVVAIGDPLLVLSRAPELGGREAKLVDRRDYTGYWEYLLPRALFTSPQHAEFGGAALIDREGRLVGVGSLRVPDAAGPGIESPGNMFVPVDALKPIMGDLIAFGRRQSAGRPWLGVISHEMDGHVVIVDVAKGSPAAAAGLAQGDLVLAVGGRDVGTLAEFYERIWSLGAPGVRVPLRVLRQDRVLEIESGSIDRLRWLKLDQTY
ncbi:MAG: S1C family serine protease [Geminicoccaceae bacterium]